MVVSGLIRMAEKWLLATCYCINVIISVHVGTLDLENTWQLAISCKLAISMGSLVTRVYRHDVHMVALTLNYKCERCMSRPRRNLSSLYVTVLEHKRGSKGQLCHKRAGQRKGNMIEWERSDAYRKSLWLNIKPSKGTSLDAPLAHYQVLTSLQTSTSDCFAIFSFSHLTTGYRPTKVNVKGGAKII